MAAPISITTPLEADLLFESMDFHAGLSMLGEVELGLLSEKSGLQPNQLLGKRVTVNIAMQGGTTRHVDGFVSRFGMGTHRGRYFGYQATVRPWLWFLTRTTDCRIFQGRTVPDIVKQIFDDHGIADFEFKLFRSYRPWTYCVQYRESDFAFVARLLEHEGIYWYFEHSAGAHKLLLVDAASAHDTAPRCDSLPYTEGTDKLTPDHEHVSSWTFFESVQTGGSALASYDFEHPSSSLGVSKSNPASHDLADYEAFDFQGDYVKAADGAQLAENRLEEIQTGFHQVQGRCNALGLGVGFGFGLVRHPRKDQNASYLVTAARVQARLDVHGSDRAGGGFDCSFSAIPGAQQFRPPRVTPKPFVQGPQTAVVTGPPGDEIYTDPHGRVKVRFHWDRAGPADDKSSCWVRVSSPWAGQNFGMIQIPRIGQEVVVDFLEGDPDQPLITGRVYNAEQMPPWDLPASATQSGILTRSSRGGSAANANSLRFEDKKGAEQVWLHAEKNQDIEVEHDETHWVGNDRAKKIDHDETVQVGHDRIEKVGHDEAIEIGRDRSMLIQRHKTETVAGDKGIKVVGSHSELIGASMSITVASTLTESVGLNYAESVGGAMELTVGGALAITVGAAMAETVSGAKLESIGGSKSEAVGGGKNVTVAKDLSESIKGSLTTSVEKDLKRTVQGQQSISVTKSADLHAKKVQITADDEISFKTGDAEILMKKNGNITISGKKITVDGDSVIVKGSEKVTAN